MAVSTSHAGQHHGELVAADAVEPVLRPRHLAHGTRHGGEHLVAGGMAVVVVHDLQVVEVHEHEAEGLSRSAAGRHAAGQLLLEGAMVARGR